MIQSYITANLRDFRRQLEIAEKKRQKAADSAIRVEAFRLSKKLRTDLKKGKAGANSFSPLRTVSKGFKPRSKKKPLSGLAKAVRYWVVKKNGKKTVKIGFGSDKVVDSRGNAGNSLSNAWVKIATKTQTGGTINPEDLYASWDGKSIRRFFLYQGASYKEDNKFPKLRKYFFLKKSTASFRLPKREIINPFWQANKQQANRNIMLNFERKMRGERI